MIPIRSVKSVHQANIMMLQSKNVRNVKRDRNTATPHSNVKK